MNKNYLLVSLVKGVKVPSAISCTKLKFLLPGIDYVFSCFGFIYIQTLSIIL